ncbi:ALS2 C-terminal-like protein, partial [Bufo gargarizans]|uniref:ALS2 C-terminal-like protein n=1 Tax=Bufo gargarizans TaxID=30331 RepID=UPI001CF1C35E
MSRPSGTSLPRRLARRDPSGKDVRRPIDESTKKNVILIETENLLRSEEDFLSSLSQIHTVVLSRLLQVTDVPDPLGNDYLTLMKLLNERFHGVWDVTTGCFQTLKESPGRLAGDIQDLYLLTEEARLLQVYTGYISAFTDFLVMKGFERSAKQSSSYWKENRKLLLQLIGERSETPIHVLLQRVLMEPFRNHVQQYSLLLSRLTPLKDASLADSIAAFERLQTFISQALDEASQTKLLWSSMSSKLV